jgi:hypothetical protein
MKYLILPLIVSLCSCTGEDKNQEFKISSSKLDIEINNIKFISESNGFNPSDRIINAIANASIQYNIPSSELTAIAIIETRLGENIKTRLNLNGSKDSGLFQINTVNHSKCIEYNLLSVEGSSMCAAKLLNEIKKHRIDYVGVYHSKTPSKKSFYIKKVKEVLTVK